MESTKKVLLDAQNLWKSYGKGEARVDALADVSLQIFDGELLTILGSSGSGKSTVCRLAARFRDIDSGTITIGGQFAVCRLFSLCANQSFQNTNGVITQVKSFHIILQIYLFLS